jgi:hypothetical protein
MGGFSRFGDIDDGKLWYGMWRKTTSVTAVTRQWYDDSMLAGIPAANFYASAPLVSATLDANDGIRHWRLEDGASEHLLEAMVFGNAGTLEAPAQLMFCDWLLYYPFLDGDSADAQDLTNTVTLPRYTDGKGLRAFIVAQGSGSGVGTFTLSYTNQDGVSGRTSSGSTVTPTASGFILTCSSGTSSNRMEPFIRLEGTDTGIRSVEQFTWTVQPGGIAALVIVKPLAHLLYAEIGTVAEQTYYPRFPKIESGAYLNVLRSQVGATPNARVFTGLVTTIRS